MRAGQRREGENKKRKKGNERVEAR